MNDAPIKFNPTTIPAGLCFASEQERLNWFASHLSGYLPGNFTAWNIGSSEPSANDRDKPWLRFNSDGSLDKVYTFFSGAWLSPHRWEPDAGVIVLWEGVLAAVDTFDGGSAGTVTDRTGPMWEVVTELAARFPIGVGTLPSTAAVALGATGGEENHALTVPELAPHTHLTHQFNGSLSAGNSQISVPYSTTATATVTDSPTSTIGGTNNSVVAHNNLPPYWGVYFLRRTARRFYTTS